MKRRLFAIIAAFAVLSLSACGGSSNISMSSEYVDETVDYDLTALNVNTMAIQVADIMTNPQNYEGKSIKMVGIYSSILDATTGISHDCCELTDKAGCCSTGLMIQFELDDPATMPSRGKSFIVKGTVDKIEGNALAKCILKDAVIVVD